MSAIALVIPTIREEQIKAFLSEWLPSIQEEKVIVYVVEDNHEKSFALAEYTKTTSVIHLSHADAPPELLEAITLKSPGCRQIGFWHAYRNRHEVILTLDDDVRPVAGSNYFASFSRILSKGISAWVDPLQNYRSRGYPVTNTGSVPTSFHVGGFLGIPDVDGETQLQNQNAFKKSPPLYLKDPVLVAPGQFIPVNGGVCGWRRDLTPYIHYTVWCSKLNYRRFDDIWMGIILKIWLDLCGLGMSYGPPFVNHFRASDPVKNAEYEKEGKAWNEDFWQKLVEQVEKRLSLQASVDWDNSFLAVAAALADIDNLWAKREAEAMRRWHEYLICA